MLKREPNYDPSHWTNWAKNRQELTDSILRHEAKEREIKAWFEAHDDNVEIHNGAMSLFGKG